MEPGAGFRKPVQEAIENLREAIAAEKCWSCGCLHGSLGTIERGLPEGQRPAALVAVLSEARARLLGQQYDCLGCEICYPAVALDALARAGYTLPPDVCPAGPAEVREGWPPLPGAYTVLRYRAPVAVCTLTDTPLAESLARAAAPGLAIVGTLQTENLGIERLIRNLVTNPHIRFLVVCGADSHQAIGHLPGGSLLALARAGLDDRLRIVGAPGKRPVLRNLSRQVVEHFRQTVAVVDRLGETDLSRLTATIRECTTRDPGPALTYVVEQAVVPTPGSLPERVVSDPAGYFVIFVDHTRGVLSLEHYRTDGLLDAILEGRSAGELYMPAVERGLLSRLDHAAYLGHELARAEQALATGQPFVQDAAPEASLAPPPAPVVLPCGCLETASGAT